MYPLLRSSPFFFLFLALLFSSLQLSTPLKIIKDEAKFEACSQEFNCGNITNIIYPFWGGDRIEDCGTPDFKLECHNTNNTEMEIVSRKFSILAIRQVDRTLTVVSADVMDDGCPDRISNTTIGDSPFEFASDNAKLTYFYNCSSGFDPSTVSSELRCETNTGPDYNGFYEVEPGEGDRFCHSKINVPILGMYQLDLRHRFLTVKEVLKKGFDLRYNDVFAGEDCSKCVKSAGRCGYNRTSGEFVCFLRPGHRAKVIVIVPIAAVGGSVILIVSVCCLMKFSSNKSILFWKKQNQTQRNIEAFLEHCGPLQARRDSYLDVKKMTKSFKEKLGQGGFGSVYRGRSHDGSLVAVKMLDESKANGEEFINEVATISRTSHVNIVSLLGFCFEGAKRALIYEFMPNGSLEKFIFNENGIENSHQLGWEMHYQISLGIARGLEYLHRGCSTRILHFDIKPHNILLDADFVPKISDFGLARICTRKESIISMSGARGTIGYIAPEVVSRNFGGISHKSDVYSYGMMVLEIIGGRKNVNIRVENTSEIYFPHWIYKRLELDEELGLKRIINEGDRVKVRKMIIVSLWCIYTN